MHQKGDVVVGRQAGDDIEGGGLDVDVELFLADAQGAELQILFNLGAGVFHVGDLVGEEEVFAGMVLRDLVAGLDRPALGGQAVRLAHVR